jgi:hypothetical protein
LIGFMIGEGTLKRYIYHPPLHANDDLSSMMTHFQAGEMM